MTEYALSPPEPEAESALFYEAAAEGRFLLRRCRDCGRAHWHPRALCPFCFGETDWEAASGRGVVYSFSVMRRAKPPYAIAYVKLEEGPTMLTNIVASAFDEIAIGKPVELVFTPTGPDSPPAPRFRLTAPG